MTSKTKARRQRAPETRVRVSAIHLAQLEQASRDGAALQGKLQASERIVIDLAVQLDRLEADTTARRSTVLGQAESLVAGDRQAMYGSPKENFDAAAAMASAYLTKRGTTTIDAHDWAMLNVLKRSRARRTRGRMENLVDMAGYVRTGEMVL
jgi:hypothetical protein